MHDEAGPTFVDMLDNTWLGQRLIFDSFGVVPKVRAQVGAQFQCDRPPPRTRPSAAPPPVFYFSQTTWQIDPFGHSTFQNMLASPLAGGSWVAGARS